MFPVDRTKCAHIRDAPKRKTFAGAAPESRNEKFPHKHINKTVKRKTPTQNAPLNIVRRPLHAELYSGQAC